MRRLKSSAISNVREKQSKQQRLQGPQPAKAGVSPRHQIGKQVHRAGL